MKDGDAPEKVEMKTKRELLSERGTTYTIGRLRLTRVVFIKSNRTRATCRLLRPTLFLWMKDDDASRLTAGQETDTRNAWLRSERGDTPAKIHRL